MELLPLVPIFSQLMVYRYGQWRAGRGCHCALTFLSDNNLSDRAVVQFSRSLEWRRIDGPHMAGFLSALCLSADDVRKAERPLRKFRRQASPLTQRDLGENTVDLSAHCPKLS